MCFVNKFRYVVWYPLPGRIVWPLKPQWSNGEQVEKLEGNFKKLMAPKSCSSKEDQRFFQNRRLLLGCHGVGYPQNVGGFMGLE